MPDESVAKRGGRAGQAAGGVCLPEELAAGRGSDQKERKSSACPRWRLAVALLAGAGLCRLGPPLARGPTPDAASDLMRANGTSFVSQSAAGGSSLFAFPPKQKKPRAADAGGTAAPAGGSLPQAVVSTKQLQPSSQPPNRPGGGPVANPPSAAGRADRPEKTKIPKRSEASRSGPRPPQKSKARGANEPAGPTAARCKPVYSSASSRPGTPCMPLPKNYPYRQKTQWRLNLGDRVLAAVTGRLAEQQCDGFELFGDSTWCLRAMKGQNVLGLSYGIEERDLWSEKMSNVFHMPTQLYDCFIPPRRSPPMAGTAPNASGPCDTYPGHCYETAYWAFRTCLGPTGRTISGRVYETLAAHLRGRGRLSTHVKIDSEGTEWAVLSGLLERESDQDKIRTLEMEVHFSYVPEGDDPRARTMGERKRLEERVRTLERLLERFRVTGSTLEVYREQWHAEENCGNGRCQEPQMHAVGAGSMSLNQFAVSYVHRDLLEL